MKLADLMPLLRTDDDSPRRVRVTVHQDVEGVVDRIDMNVPAALYVRQGNETRIIPIADIASYDPLCPHGAPDVPGQCERCVRATMEVIAS